MRPLHRSSCSPLHILAQVLYSLCFIFIYQFPVSQQVYNYSSIQNLLPNGANIFKTLFYNSLIFETPSGGPVDSPTIYFVGISLK